MSELDSLPEGWSIAKLGDLANIISGGTPSKTRPDYWHGSIPWASPKDIKRSRLYDTQDHISEAGLADGSRLVSPGTIFIVVRGMILAKDLPVSMAMVPMAFNQDMKAIVPNGRAHADYLLYALTAHKRVIMREIGTSAHGTRRIGTEAIAEYQMPQPPMIEQSSIAQTLTVVQRARDATTRIIAATQSLKESLAYHLFTFGPASRDKVVELTDTNLGTMPSHWQVSDLGSEVKLTQYGISLRGEASGRYPILRMNNLFGGRVVSKDLQYVDLSERDFTKYRLARGDILFNRTNSFELVGKTSVLDSDEEFVFASYLIRLVTKADRLLPEFLNYFMNLGKTQTRLKLLASRGVSQSNINATKLKGLSIPLPPLPEQEKLVIALKAVDAKIAAEQARKEALSVLFDSLMYHLMTGKVRVGEFALA